MTKRILFLPALLLVAALAVVLGTGGLVADAAPAGAATGLNLAQESCAPDGSVAALLSWTPSGAGTQTADLALDPSFANFSRGGPYASNANAVSFVSMTQGVTYYARVNTSTSFGMVSSDSFAFTASCQAPSSALTPATALNSYGVTANSVNFTWQPGVNNIWYCVNVARNYNDVYTGPTWRNYGCWQTGTTLQVTGLTCGTTYYWNVYTWNTTTNAQSAISSFTTAPCAPAITPPTNLYAYSVGAHSAVLNWAPGNSNIWYCVQTAQNVHDILYGGPTWSNHGCWTTAPSIQLTGLACGTTYYWNVYAWNYTTNTSSNYSTFTTDACGPTTQQAPIDHLSVTTVGSNPTEYVVHIVAGLPGGCASPGSHQVYRHDSVVDITVLNNVAPNQNCTAIYGQYHLDINLGSNFASGHTYTVNVNDRTTTFTAQ
ncbi:MAG TPA: fibronectin type III domain-containing protein [Dehalococcoidia bacterium]|nr:fibronectin type III domain-containing protein [Dehalococcoidia bacterium]